MGPSAVYLLNAFLLSLVLTGVLRHVAPRLGLVDIPTGRKKHTGHVPLVGGIAIFVAFSVAAVMLEKPQPLLWGFLAGSSFLLLIGIVDDIRDLSAIFKLVLQSVAALLMILLGGGTLNLGTMLNLPVIDSPGWSIAMTVILIVATINAFNMIDGLDGLAGGVACLALLWFAVAAFLLARPDVASLALLLGCAIGGFLVFNMRHPWLSQAEIFLGNSGSMVLGAALAFFAVKLSNAEGSQMPICVGLWILALPMIDMLSVVIRRVRARESPMRGDRRHLHHLLLKRGFSVNEAVMALLGASVALGGVGLVAWLLDASQVVMLSGLGVAFALHSYFVRFGQKHLRMPWYRRRGWRTGGMPVEP